MQRLVFRGWNCSFRTYSRSAQHAYYKIPIVNPIAMIESACMMLDYLNEKGIAGKDKESDRRGYSKVRSGTRYEKVIETFGPLNP